MKRSMLVTVIAMVVVAGWGQPSRAAAPRTAPEPYSYVFDLGGLSGWQRTVAKETLRCFDFDWRLLIPDLRASGAGERVEITTGDLSPWKAVGLAWPAPVNRIEIEETLTDHEWFRAILVHELGHIVDHHLVSASGLADDIAVILGREWADVSHPFVNIFSQAFSCYETPDTDVPVTDDQLLQVRSLLGGSGPLPEKRNSTEAHSTAIERGEARWARN